MFGNAQRQGRAAGRGRGRRLHSIAGMLEGKRFAGAFELNGSTYRFIYDPARAEVIDRRLRLRGTLTVRDARGRARSQENVGALLVATQGGVGAAPIRRQIMVGGVATGTAATSGQQQQAAGQGEGAARREQQGARSLPEVDSTGPFSFCGVMYFHLDRLNGAALGVSANLDRVQLNARLAPADEPGRDLQALYSTVADALYTGSPDDRLATATVGEINKQLTARVQ